MNTFGQGKQLVDLVQAAMNARRGNMRLNLDTSTPPNLRHLHKLVVQNNGRVEFHMRDGSTSVLISKSELDAIEQALEILSETDGVRAMRNELAKIAALSASPV